MAKSLYMQPDIPQEPEPMLWVRHSDGTEEIIPRWMLREIIKLLETDDGLRYQFRAALGLEREEMGIDYE